LFATAHTPRNEQGPATGRDGGAAARLGLLLDPAKGFGPLFGLRVETAQGLDQFRGRLAGRRFRFGAVGFFAIAVTLDE
jgi:hypothetical protein